MPTHQIESPVWLLRRGCWTPVPFWIVGMLRAEAVPEMGERMTRLSGRRGLGGPAGRTPGGGGGGAVVGEARAVLWGLAGYPLAAFFGLLGARGGCASFPSCSLWPVWR